MADPTDAPVVQTPNPEGDGDEGRKVSYDTHRKLLDEKKKLDQRVKDFEDAQAMNERKLLEEKGDYQKLTQLKDEELAKTKAELQSHRELETNRQKLSKFVRALPGEIDSKFFGFIPLDEIVIDPATGEVDAMSVSKAAENFRTKYPELIQKKGAPLPNTAPQGTGGGMISHAEWKKLPLKEMQAYDKRLISD